MKKSLAVLVLGLVASSFGQKLAVQEHVKLIGDNKVKYTSKLKGVVHLNFCMGFEHTTGIPRTAKELKAVTDKYGLTLKSFTGANGGTKSKSVPFFSLDSLTKNGQVLFANNVSSFGNAALPKSQQDAIQQAIETHGMGYMGNHGSGDNRDAAWPWYTNTFYPVDYNGHGNRTEKAPIYKNPSQASHIVLDGIWEKAVVEAQVPDGVDAGGSEKLITTKVRRAQNEWYWLGNDMANDPKFKDSLVVIMKYDPRGLTNSALPAQYRRKGGNTYSMLYKVGKGITSYLPPGHDNNDMDAFDAETGDLQGYIARVLFFVAGYNVSICDESCIGLPIADSKNLLTGDTLKTLGGGTSIEGFRALAGQHYSYFHPNKISFVGEDRGAYRVQLTDIRGQVVDEAKGRGRVEYNYAKTALRPGVYFLRTQLGQDAPQLKRYVVAGG